MDKWEGMGMVESPRTTEVLLAAATIAEAPLLLSVILRAFAEFWDQLDPPSGVFGETAQSIAAKLAKGGAIKALVGEEVVGCVIYEPRPTLMYFGRLAVLPQWRRSGLAAQLIHAVEECTLASGLSCVQIGVRLVLPSHQRYYQRLGYQPIAYECHPGFTQPTSVTMEKQLRPAFQEW